MVDYIKGTVFYTCLLTILLLSYSTFSMETSVRSSPVAFDTIAGPLPKTVKAKDTPYYVVADIEVPANKEVTIEPGVVFLFKNFTGLHVNGKLMAEGTKTQPIIFTSENDKTYNPESTLLPNPYDWNGIYIHDDAFSTVMIHCKVAYTVYGIISDTKFIKLDPVSFLENGRSNLVIAGKDHTVTDEPYKYSLSIKDATKEGVPIRILKDPQALKRNILRYTGLTAAIGGFGIGIYYATQLKDTWHDWKEVNTADPDDPDDKEIFQKDPSYFEITRERKKEDLSRMCLGMGLGLIGTIAFTWSFTF